MPEVCRSKENDVEGFFIADGAFTWEETVRMIERKSFIFGRELDVARMYKKHLDKVATEWDSMESFCKHTFLKMDVSLKRTSLPGIGVTTVKCVDSPLESVGMRIAVIENNFRYALSPEIKHFTLWSTQSLTTEEHTEKLKEHFPPTEYDVLVFENPDEQKSVIGVPHIHVFARKKATSPT